MTLKYQTSKARASQQFVAEFSPHLTTIFNTSIAKGEVPTDWRQANVIPIFKKGEKFLASNYRPVSLTCICCKLLEHIVVSNILKHLDLHNILSSRLSTWFSCKKELWNTITHTQPWTAQQPTLWHTNWLDNTVDSTFLRHLTRYLIRNYYGSLIIME